MLIYAFVVVGRTPKSYMLQTDCSLQPLRWLAKLPISNTLYSRPSQPNQKSKQNKCRNCTRPGAVRPFSSALERWKQSQVDHRELQARQGYVLRPCLEKTTKPKPTKTIKNPNPQNPHNSLKPPVGQSLKDNSRRRIKSNDLVSW